MRRLVAAPQVVAPLMDPGVQAQAVGISAPVGEYSTGVANIFILFYKLACRANVVSFLHLLGNIQLGSQTFNFNFTN